MSIRLFEENKEVFRRVAREAGVSEIRALYLSRCVLFVPETDRVDSVRMLLDKYLPGNGYCVKLESQTDKSHSDILVYESGGKYYWNNTEENLECLKETMSEEEKAIYASYNIFGAG